MQFNILKKQELIPLNLFLNQMVRHMLEFKSSQKKKVPRIYVIHVTKTM